MKLWRIAFGLRPSHLTLGKAMQASLSSRLIGTLMMLAAFSLASCGSDDDDKDIVEQVTIFVSAETGTYQNVPDNNYVEGMMIREQGESTSYCVSFQTITGFTYERGHEYELLVKRTTLANPPQDSGMYRYELSASCRIRKSNNINHS